jgi:hypothetical protein
MAIRSKMRTNSKSKRGTLKSKRRSIKRQRGGDSKHGSRCSEDERKKIIFEGTEPLICKKSLKHLIKKDRKRKSTLSENKQRECYNTTCWHRLSMKDKIMYKSKIKKAEAKLASDLTKKGKEAAARAEAEARARAETEAAEEKARDEEATESESEPEPETEAEARQKTEPETEPHTIGKTRQNIQLKKKKRLTRFSKRQEEEGKKKANNRKKEITKSRTKRHRKGAYLSKVGRNEDNN